MSEEFNAENIPSSSWMKFTKVGDYVKGTLVETSEKEGVGDFKDQTVYKLTNVEAKIDGEMQEDADLNVGISSVYVIDRLKKVKEGQRMGIQFEKEIPAKVKGHHPAKSLVPNVWGMDPDYKGQETFE